MANEGQTHDIARLSIQRGRKMLNEDEIDQSQEGERAHIPKGLDSLQEQLMDLDMGSKDDAGTQPENLDKLEINTLENTE